MRIAVIGAGGVGGAFGAALAKAGGRCDVRRARGPPGGDACGRPQGAGPARRRPSQPHPGHRPAGRHRPGRFRAVLRQAVGRGKCRRRHPAADRAEHGGHPAAERDRRQRAADPDPRQGGCDGRRGADQRHHRRARRDPPDRHLHAPRIRRAGRHVPASAAPPSTRCARAPASTRSTATRSSPRCGRNSSCSPPTAPWSR